MMNTTTRPITRPAPGTRADYRSFLTIATRWMDNDVFGHLNNVVYYSFFDTAVTRALMDRGILDWKDSAHFLVVAESGCRYHREAAFPSLITAGIRLAGLGTSSVRHEIGVFADDAQTASAEGFMVHVCVDGTTRRPAPMPDAWRTALQALSLKH